MGKDASIMKIYSNFQSFLDFGEGFSKQMFVPQKLGRDSKVVIQ